MKRAVIILLDILHSQGAENVAVNIAVRLSGKAEFRPVVFVTRVGGELEDVLRAHDIKYQVLGRRGARDVFKLTALPTFIKEENAQLIHAHKIGSNVWGSIAGKISGVPVIAHVHGQAGTPANRLADKLIASLSDRMVTVCEHERRRLIDEEGIPPSKVTTVYNGIRSGDYKTRPDPQTRAKLGLGSNDVVVGISAAFRTEKQHEVFLLAAKEISEKRSDARFLLIGDGETRARIENYAESLGLRQRCLFPGFVRNLADYLSVIDVGVLASAREGLPLTVLQYMASSKPVVATDVGGVREVIRDGVEGYVVPPGDHRMLSEKIIRLLDNGDLARKMGENGLGAVNERFSEDAMMTKIEQIYEDTLAKRRNGPRG